MDRMITSNQNPKIKLMRALLGRSKERRDAGAFVAEGVRLVEEAVRVNWPIRSVLFDETLSERGRSVIAALTSQNVEVEEVSPSVMQSISETETPQGILAVLDFHLLSIPRPLNFILIPDQIRDPGNLGTLLRSAVASGVQAVIIPPETTDVFAPKVLRSGMGAHFQLPIYFLTWEEIQRQLNGLQIYIADMDGRSCWNTDLRQPIALVVGSEADGASASAREVATDKLSIPMAGDIESLNAGVAGSVLMFEVMRQRSNG
jgi:TrmH family RNA methyltransferase